MEVGYDIIKRFQFDLEMGRFNANDSVRGYSRIKFNSKEELLTVTYILNYLFYCNTDRDNSLIDYIVNFDWLYDDDCMIYALIDVKTKRYRVTNNSTIKKDYVESVPEYLKGIEVKLQ